MSSRDNPANAENQKIGVLYLVATPIGNLEDLSHRALETLREVDVIAAEDTRHTRALLTRHGISTPAIALHDHNESRVSTLLVERMRSGESIAVVSDAGTPLISDPGLPLVRTARDAGIRVVPVPGPCAFVAALSASGLPTARFCFEGFPPRTGPPRRAYFESLRSESRTLIFYEASHRVRETVRDMAAMFEPTRVLVIARELTKMHETIVSCRLADAENLFEEPNMLRGEFVLLLEGALAIPKNHDALDSEHERILRLLLAECSVRTASRLAAKITRGSREAFYRRALELAGNPRTDDG